jgi:hypothetical protein
MSCALNLLWVNSKSDIIYLLFNNSTSKLANNSKYICVQYASKTGLDNFLTKYLEHNFYAVCNGIYVDFRITD